ncbi:MAG: hypothetical protein KDC34_10135 [Saprospiraceae bacterium]|nr:hypothetical protein [Saprospiraceae bacterium]
MRIIGEIPHLRLKITVFQMNEKLSIKLEDGLLEQIYKFRKGEGIELLEDAKRFCTPTFLQSVESIFRAMNENRFKNLTPSASASDNEFDQII